MPRPPDGLFHLFLIALLLLANASLIASAQQKRLTQSQFTISPRGKSTFYEDEQDHSLDSHDVRAIATTLAPVPERAVGAPSAKRSATGGLSSRLSARSLQDWDVEDVVLLATIDGKIHARDRRTGAPRWELEADRPVVETIYHSRNRSIDGSMPVNDEFLWIVEPSQDGSLYIFIPGVSFGVQKLDMTIKQLHELTPFASDDPPIRYLVDRKTILYTVDVSTGNILKMFSPGSSAVLDEKSCRRVRGLEGLEEDECRVTGTLNLGRTEYTVQVSSTVTSELVATIKYFEWGPNQRDRDLINQYASTKDNRYVYTRFNGEAMASHHLQDSERTVPELLYTQKFSSPVAQVFDIARPANDDSSDASLIILPQPSAPMSMGVRTFDVQDRVFVNCTESGSWYALSETRYPMVTAGANSATCLNEEYRSNMPIWKEKSDVAFKLALTGVHDLTLEGQKADEVPIPLIGGPEEVSVKEEGDLELPSSYLGLRSYFPASSLLLVVAIVTLLFYPKFQLKLPHTASIDIPETPFSDPVPLRDQEPLVGSKVDPPVPTKPVEEVEGVKEEVAKVTNLNHEQLSPLETISEQTTTTLGSLDPKIEAVEPQQTNPAKKKKAHRGNRGGRAQREKEKAKLVSLKETAIPEPVVEEIPAPTKEITIEPDVISKHAPVQDNQSGLHNLQVRFDRILGSGSGGTFVFEGMFEGRDVAVKRMLRQQYELASQEVSLLEQNDEHTNVIRYFCRREDENFLYIALELCQASLWDLFRDGRGSEGIENKQLTLRDELLHDPRRVLKQLAEGLNYLHSFRIVHRDIKPQNMLIAYPKKNSLKAFPRLVISDFGLCKTLPENVSTLIGTTGNAGTAGWMAPELISQPKDSSNNGSHQSTTQTDQASNRSDATLNGNGGGTSGKVKRAIDIFSLGCVFFYVLTHGQHPFDDEEGWMALRERNIKTGRAKNLKALDLLGPDTVDLIEWMLQHDPEDRPTASQVLAHPFFWDAEDRLEFLSAASDRFDQEPRDGTSLTLREIERCAVDVIPKFLPGAYSQSATHSHLRLNNHTEMPLPIPEPNFLAALDRRFVDTLGRQRKYDPGRITDLLRALRNKHHHWDDMPEEVKARVGEVPEGYLHFWESRFPGLVVRVWRVVGRLGIGAERRFGRWFAGRGNHASLL